MKIKAINAASLAYLALFLSISFLPFFFLLPFSSFFACLPMPLCLQSQSVPTNQDCIHYRALIMLASQMGPVGEMVATASF